MVRWCDEMFNYQITYDINSASVYDDNYVIHFNFDSQEIIINDNKYNMYEIPLKYANLLLPIWYQVILGMDGFKPITIIKVYNCYLSYEFKTKENNIKNQSDFNIKESNFKIKENYDDLKIPDMIHSYEPGEVIQ